MPALPTASKTRAERIISSTKTVAPSMAEAQFVARSLHEIATDSEVTNGGHRSESARLADELTRQPSPQAEAGRRETLGREAINWARANI